jgi:hypothetical protein
MIKLCNQIGLSSSLCIEINPNSSQIIPKNRLEKALQREEYYPNQKARKMYHKKKIRPTSLVNLDAKFSKILVN